MGSQAERMGGKVVDRVGEEGLAERETKDSEIAFKYCGLQWRE